MRPDLFTELIRRKLESIRPDVTDRDWTRMQRSLRQAGLSGPPNTPAGGIGSVPSWLLPVVGIGLTALLTVAVWQQSEIRTLREKLVQQATMQPAPTPPATESGTDQTAAPAPLPSQTVSTDRRPNGSRLNAAERGLTRPDTVYVTRYVPIKPANGIRSGKDNRTQSMGIGDESTATPVPSPPVDRRMAANEKLRTQATDTPDPENKQLADSSLNRESPTNAVASSDASNKAPLLPSRTKAAEDTKMQRVRSSQTKLDGLNLSGTNESGTVPSERNGKLFSPTDTNSATDDVDAAANPVTASATDVRSLDVTRSLLTRPVNWPDRLTRRFTQAATTLPTVNQVANVGSESSVRQRTTFRIGVGSDLRARYWNTGLVAEAVLGGRWVLSTGLVRSGSLLGSFVTDEEYNYRTRREFRREFAPGFDKKSEIYGINVRSIRYQIPVSLGYRIPVGKSLSVLPSLGGYLDLSNDVTVTFSHRTPPPRPGYETKTFRGKGPISRLNAYTAGAALEWQQAHWVVQGGILFARPFYSTPNETAAPALGGRLRLLYQF